nr:MAG TPA: hypothetical protein [Caudoviricetes sp.]
MLTVTGCYSPKRLAVAGNTRENAGPPEQGCNSYCFSLLLTTSGAVVGIFGRGAKVVIGHAP